MCNLNVLFVQELSKGYNYFQKTFYVAHYMKLSQMFKQKIEFKKVYAVIIDASAPHVYYLYCLIIGFAKHRLFIFKTFWTLIESNFFVKCQKFHNKIPIATSLMQESV